MDTSEIPHSRKVRPGKSLVILLFMSIWQKNWQFNRLAKKLLIIHSNLDEFSLANHG